MVSSKPDLDPIVIRALDEDLGESRNDVTTDSIVEPELLGEAVSVAGKRGCWRGVEWAARVFELMRPACEYRALVADGARIEAGDTVAQVTGPLGALLTAARTALHFLQR